METNITFKPKNDYSVDILRDGNQIIGTANIVSDTSGIEKKLIVNGFTKAGKSQRNKKDYVISFEPDKNINFIDWYEVKNDNLRIKLSLNKINTYSIDFTIPEYAILHTENNTKINIVNKDVSIADKDIGSLWSKLQNGFHPNYSRNNNYDHIQISGLEMEKPFISESLIKPYLVKIKIDDKVKKTNNPTFIYSDSIIVNYVSEIFERLHSVSSNIREIITMKKKLTGIDPLIYKNNQGITSDLISTIPNLIVDLQEKVNSGLEEKIKSELKN